MGPHCPACLSRSSKKRLKFPQYIKQQARRVLLMNAIHHKSKRPCQVAAAMSKQLSMGVCQPDTLSLLLPLSPHCFIDHYQQMQCLSSCRSTRSHREGCRDVVGWFTVQTSMGLLTRQIFLHEIRAKNPA